MLIRSAAALALLVPQIAFAEDRGAVQTFRGIVSRTAGVWQVAPCGADRSPVAIGDGTGADLERTHRALSPDPATGVYMELRVRPGTGERGPRAVSVRRAALEGRGCAETWDDEVLRARGNEPFWTLVVRPSSIVFERPGETPRRFPAVTPLTTGATRVFDARAAAERIVVRVTEQRCMDGMSGERFPFTVEVTTGESTVRGCGAERPATDESRPEGR
jgi:uncharacterized membrane protein